MPDLFSTLVQSTKAYMRGEFFLGIIRTVSVQHIFKVFIRF